MMSFVLRQIIENNSISPPVVIHITDGEVRIGRKFKASVERFPQISRHHATIFQSDNNCLFIKDEGSLNGTFVNDGKITGRQLKSLSVGDRIGFGISCNEPNNGLVCIVCCDDPPYKVKDEVIVISDNDDEVPGDNCPKKVNVDSSEDEVSVVNNYNDANNFDFKIVNCTSKAKVKVPFSSNDPSRIPPTVNSNINSISSFPSTFATKARKSFVGSSTKIHRLAPPVCATVAETHPTKTLKTVNLSESNTRTLLNYYEIQSSKLNDSDDKKISIRNVKGEDVSNSASTFSNCTINSSSKNSYEDKANSLTADRKLFLNNNVADSLTNKKLKTINTSHLASLSTEASINSDFHKITTPCKGIGATKSVGTTSLTSVPDFSKHNFKRKSSIENLPRKECTVYLVKCDSDAFKFPPDVKNPFLKKHNNVPKASVHKRVKKHSRNSKSGALNLENELPNIEDQESNTTKQPNIEKRKSSVDDKVLDTYPSKKVCLTSKKKDVTCTKKKPRYNVGSESDSDNNEITYSQKDEVIDITDDDIYLDFQSSQNFVYIKKEPGEIEDEHEDEIYADIFENDNEYDNLDDKASQLDDNFVESIESIKAFVGCNDEKEQKELENNLADDNNCLESSFFPVLSQGFESEEENNNYSKSCSKKVPSSPDSQDLSEEEDYYKEEPIKERKDKELSKLKLTDPKSYKAIHFTGEQGHKKIQEKNNNKSYSKNVPTGRDAPNLYEEIYYIEEPLRNGKDKGISKINQKEKKLSKIKLCEPKPLSYRPMYKKGRDENFVERSKPTPISKSSKNTPKSFKKRSPTKEENINTRSNFNKFKIPLKRTLPQGNKSETEPYKDDDSCSNLPGSSSKKSLSVKRRPEKFASRMGFLTNEIEINPRKLNKPISKVPGIMRQNSSSLLVKQNNLANNIHNSGVCNQSSESVVAQSSACIVSQNSTPIVTPRPASHAIPMCAPFNTPRPESVITPRPASDGFHISASISEQNSAVPINAVKKPTDSLQISNKNDIIRPRDPRQNRVVQSSKQPEITPASTTISDKRSVNYKSSNSNNQSPGNFRNNYPNNLIMNSLRFSIIKNLLKLQTGWLQEQKNRKVPPPPVYEGADYLELRFKSYESYVSSFCPMLMLELWEQMYVDSKEIIDSQKQYKKFYFSILSYSSRGDCIELKCESVVNDKVSFCPREGNLVILELKENAHRCSPAFGYIFHHKVQSLDLKNLTNLHWKNLPKESGWLTNAKHYTFLAYVKRRDKPFAMDDLMKGNGLSYIGNKLRLLDAMSYMKNSPLMSDFLAPRWNTFLVNYSKCSPSMDYNTCQAEVINGVSAEISKSSETSKIILLQGPPGTGKTHTIIGLLQKLIHDKKFSQNFKVLVAAPSNAAIDEIGCRLIEVNKKLSSPGIKFVRIGAVEQVNPKMKPYFIDKKARELFEKDSKSAYNQKNDELQKLRMQIDNLRKQPDSMHRNERMQHLEHRYKLCYNSVSSNNMDYYTEMDYKTKILKESHIILSTLSSCGLTILLKTFKPNSGIYFSCCIVDECTQCTELEILQPLVLGINKLILVGDHKQLPATVTSKLACKYGFERSAFERFHLFFEKYFKKTPMYTLSEQFRMHSAICEFPSRYIYDKKIVTHPDTDLKYKSFPFHPYFILDIPSQESDDSSSKINCAEASVIVHICTGLIDIVDSSSIGIITPYQAQRSLYVNALKVNPHYQNIEVNTVDGFQGREKDIIILSSVRANSQSGSIGFLACKRRLNVAITRARKCLIICAHADSLMNNLDWRELIFDAKRRNLCVGVPSPKDIPMIFKYNLKKDRPNLC